MFYVFLRPFSLSLSLSTLISARSILVSFFPYLFSVLYSAFFFPFSFSASSEIIDPFQRTKIPTQNLTEEEAILIFSLQIPLKRTPV